MNFARGIGRWLLAIAIGFSIAAWISVWVLQSTLLSRDTVKGWLASSGVYDNSFKPFANIDIKEGIAKKEDFMQALEQTFQPGYVRTQTEKALDATYDWIDGKSGTISFSIPVADRREEFRNNLVKVVTPRLAQLPACPTRVNPNTNNPTCIPQGMNAASFADQSLRFADNSTFLNAPITQDSLKDAGFAFPDMSYLPSVAAAARTATVALPIAIIIMGAGYVLLSESKLRGLTVIGRRVLLQGAIVALGGGLLAAFGSSIDLSAAAEAGDAQQATMVAAVINPLVKIIMPSLGQAFLAAGAVVAATGGVAWLVAFIIRRNYTKVTQFTPGPKPPVPPRPTQQPPTTQTPPTAPSQPASAAKTMPRPQPPTRIIQ